MTDAARCIGHRSAVQWHMQRAAFSEAEPPLCQAHTACPSPRRPLHPLRKPIFSPKHKAANHEETSWQPLPNPTFRPGQRASATEPAAPKPKQPAAQRLAQALHQAADTAAAAGQFVRRALWSLRIRHVRLVLPVYAPDAAACALACGKVHAELGAAFGLLQNFFRIEVEEVRIEPDFLDQRAEKFALSGQITARLLPLAIAGLRMVFRLADAKVE